MSKAPSNLHQRHQNRRALEKKRRAKERHLQEPTTHEHIVQPGSRFVDAPGGGVTREGILSEAKGRTLVLLSAERYFECTLPSTHLATFAVPFAVGDRFLFDERPDGNVIREWLSRRTVLTRLRGDRQRLSAASKEEHAIAANVDVAVIVAAAVDPEFHPRFVDRYLIVCQNGGIAPVICLNKCDLIDTRHPVLKTYRALGIPVVETSAVTHVGVAELLSYLRGKVAVLVGHSGVGKSSLINQIVPDLGLPTKAVSNKSRRGRHTTTGSHLYSWESRSYIIDTPGIRALGVGHLPREALQYGFPEFLPYIDHCRFRNCLHETEPDCAVRAAVATGLISSARYDSYLRILHE